MKKEEGNIGDLLATGFCLLVMTVMMMVYLSSARLIQQKAEVSQIARKYILRMETVGMLTDTDSIALHKELESAGVSQIRLTGTTVFQVEYGAPVILQIQGRWKNGYEFTEKRASTAKH